MGKLVTKTLPFMAEKNCVVAIPYWHYRVHEGEMFQVECYYGAVANTAFADMLFTTHADYEMHLAIGIPSGGGIQNVRLYENPTNVSGGTALTAFDLNRSTSNSCHATITYAPVVVDTGSTQIIKQRHLLGDDAIGNFGIDVIQNMEHIFKKNEQYFLRVQNSSGGAMNMSIVVEFYEVAV